MTHLNWTTPDYVLFILSIQMLSGYGKDEKITRLIDEMDFYVLPVFNADGYIYTWEKVSATLVST